MKYENSYRDFDEFVRDVLKPNSGPAWSVDQFVDELFLEDDYEFIPGITAKKEEDGDDWE
jgi:hypothetical protein